MIPNRIGNVAGSWPDGDKYMQNWDVVEALARGNYLSNPGQENWINGTSFSSPADAAALSTDWTNQKGGTAAATYTVTQEGTTKDTGAYALRINITGAGSADSYIRIKQSHPNFVRFGGQTMLFGARVKLATGTKVRLSIYDGTTTAYSDYHTGDGTWQKLTVSLAAQAVPTELTVKLEITSDFTDNVYLDSMFLYAINSQMDATAKAAMAYQITDEVQPIDVTLLSRTLFQARLTLASGTPVTDADQTAKTTVYLTPFGGNLVSLYDGARWNLHQLVEISISVPATTNTIYDLFLYNNSGTLTLEAVSWTNDTTRATALAVQDGIYVKNGTLTKRYVGTFRTTGSSGQTEDSEAKRYLYNYYHRRRRPLKKVESTDTWSYTTDSFRQANNSAANQIDVVIGVSEDAVTAEVVASGRNDAGGTNLSVGIGVDSTSTNSATIQGGRPTATADSNVVLIAKYIGYPGIGRHYLAWLERSQANGTSTWLGDNADSSLYQSGITGEIWG